MGCVPLARRRLAYPFCPSPFPRVWRIIKNYLKKPYCEQEIWQQWPAKEEKITRKMSEGLENEKQTHLFRSTVLESRASSWRQCLNDCMND